jgi:hypothetical protein
LLLLAPFAGRFAPPDVPAALLQTFAEFIAAGALLFLGAAFLAWWQLSAGQTVTAVGTLALGSLLAVSLSAMGHDSYARLKTSKALVVAIGHAITPQTEVFSVRTYEQTFPFYLGRTVTLVDYVDEFEYGWQFKPANGIAKLDNFTARWRTLTNAVAIMGPDTYAQLQQQHLPMRVLYHDIRRIVVARS